MQDDPTPRDASSGLERVIGRLGFSAVVLNGVIGAGIFGLPALAAARVGTFSPWLFVLCALMIMTIVVAFAQAASAVTSTGGPIVYATRAFGPFVGFQTGWLYWVSRLAAFAANSVLMVSYAAYFVPALERPGPQAFALSALIVTLTVINVVGIRSGMAFLYLMSVLKLLPLLLLVVIGLPRFDVGLLVAFEVPDPGTLGEAMLVLMYAFVGFEAAVIPAGEGRSPRRDLPFALLTTTGAVTALYFVLQWLSLSVVPDLASSERPLADAAAVVLGGTGATLLVLGAVFSIGGNNSASVLGAPRLTFALGRDGLLPAWFGRVHPRFHTPANSILFYGVFALALALTGSFVWLAVMSTLVRLLGYAVVILSLPRLQRAAPEEQPLLRIPGGMTIPGIGLLLCLWLATRATVDSWLLTGAFLVLGTVLWLAERRFGSRGVGPGAEPG